MKSFISLFAAAAAAAFTFVSVEASHALKGQHAGTNAQRFSRGLPPKPMVKSDVRMRRALRPRASALTDRHLVLTPGASCGCTYNSYTNTIATYEFPADMFVASDTVATWAACQTYCDNNANCYSTTFDSSSGQCTIWNGEPSSLVNAASNNYFMIYNDGASNCRYQNCNVQ